VKDRRIAISLACVCAACGPRSPHSGSAAPAEARVELPGCYALYSGDGRSVDGRFYNASPVVRLDTTDVDRRWVQGAARPMIRLDSTGRPMETPEWHVRPFWEYDPETDSLELSFNNGFSGAALLLHAPPGPRDTLRGTIHENWDVGPISTTPVSAYAVRVSCPG
jgi:hypothetical protein